MKLPPVPYSQIALGAVAISVVANFIQAISQTEVWILFIANAVCLVALSSIAVQFYRESRAGFDPVVAAETIVAFGVTSLILSLVSAVYPLLGANKLANLFQGGGLAYVATPFLEGLSTAGLAPLAAMVLRNRVSELDGAFDPIGDATGLTRAMSSLTREIEAARNGMTNLQTSLTSAASSTKMLADTVETECNRLKLLLLEAQGEIKAFGGAAHDSRAEVGELATQTARLKTSVTDTGTLLAALADLIASVERFVAPGTRRRK